MPRVRTVAGVLVGTLVLGLAAAPASAGPASWTVETVPTTSVPQSLPQGTSCADPSFCVSVGLVGHGDSLHRPLIQMWDGQSWNTAVTPQVSTSGAALTGVDCPTTTFCAAVGYLDLGDLNHRPLIMTWNGTSWRVADGASVPAGTATLTAVSCPSAGVCTAVGWYDDAAAGHQRLLAETLARRVWTAPVLPDPGTAEANLLGVDCPTTTVCLAVGFTATVSFGARTALAVVARHGSWRQVAVELPAYSTESSLGGVSCAAATMCVPVGYTGNARGIEVPLAELWNGSGFSILATPSRDHRRWSVLSGVSCPTTTSCMAVGKELQSSSWRNLTETWDGAAWVIRDAPTPVGALGHSFASVACPVDGICFAVGDFTVQDADYLCCHRSLVDRWNGTAWRRQSAPDLSLPDSGTLLAVSCPDTGMCFAVGNEVHQPGYAVLDALIVRREDGAWVQQSDAPLATQDNSLSGVSCPSRASCVAVGTSNRTHPISEIWDGTSWMSAGVPMPAGAQNAFLSSVSCSSPTACLAIGTMRAIGDSAFDSYAEVWDGATWAYVGVPDPGNQVLAGVSCTSATSCVVAGYHLGASAVTPLALFWDGVAFTATVPPQPATGNAQLTGISCVASGACMAAGFVRHGPTQTPLIDKWNGTTWRTAPAPARSVDTISCVSVKSCVTTGTYVVDGARQPQVQMWDGTTWTSPALTAPPYARTQTLTAVSCAAPKVCSAVGSYSPKVYTDLPYAQRIG